MGAKDVSHVQKLVLSALLGSEPRPELRALLGNPEIMTAVSGPITYLLSENLGDSVADAFKQTSLRIVDHSELMKTALETGDTPYLYFGPAEDHGDRIRLSVNAGMARSVHSGAIMPLGGAVLEFQRSDGGWTVSSPPSQFAT